MKNSEKRVYLEALAAYGGKCACCGETYLPFLSLDHVNGDGWKDRERDGAGNRSSHSVKFAYWLRNNHYPNNIQVLCMNCNKAKGNKDRCPCNGGSATQTVEEELSKLPPRINTAKGTRHPNAKLTDEKVLEIRALYKNGKTLNELASMFTLGTSTVHNVVQRTTWKHV